MRALLPVATLFVGKLVIDEVVHLARLPLSYALSYVRTSQRRELDYVRQVATSPDTAKEIKIFGLSSFPIDRYRTISRDTYAASRKPARQRASGGAGFAALGTVAYSAAYTHIAWRAVAGSLSIGNLMFLAVSFLPLRGLPEELLTGFDHRRPGALPRRSGRPAGALGSRRTSGRNGDKGDSRRSVELLPTPTSVRSSHTRSERRH